MLLWNPHKLWQIVNPSANRSIKLNGDDHTPMPEHLRADIFSNIFASALKRDASRNLSIYHGFHFPPMPGIIFSPAGISNIIEEFMRLLASMK